MSTVIATPRLALRPLTRDDAPFILALLNEAAFIRYIGDKGVRSLADAADYIAKGPQDSYERHGFGLYATCLHDGTLVGMCGLVKREGLDAPDVGYAFLSQFWGQGFAVESAAAVLEHARTTLKIKRVLAIVSADNAASIAVLNKIGLRYECDVRLAADHDVQLFAPAPSPA